MNSRKTRVWLSVLIQLTLPVLLLAGCATNESHALQQNKELVRRYFEGWANRGDAAVADAVIATNLVLRNPPHVVHGLAAYKQGMAAFHTAFPDLRFTIDDEIAEGTKVAVRWTLRATNHGEYQGHAASGKAIAVTGISMFQIDQGKIQEITVNMDRLGQLEQLGWLPAPAPLHK